VVIDALYSTSSMSIGLQGVKDTDVDKVKSTIKSVLEQVKQEGFDPKRIEAAIHQMELGQKHVSHLIRRLETIDSNFYIENC
jgi:Zn-dependent M16 (insulinase) family peptidase